LQLAIGEYRYTRTEGRFTDEVVCRDVMGALVLLMNLQLENFTNKKNVSVGTYECILRFLDVSDQEDHDQSRHPCELVW
jgi:hypothetical protein